MKKSHGQENGVIHITPAGVNVFADLGFEPEEASKLKIKSQLMIEISEWIKSQQLKQDDAAQLLKVSRPRISDVMTGKIDKFTIDALVEMLQLAGKHVTVKVA
ncbi:MAG: XRE family transcriptional regulator [Gammaproteobacteria bacterium]|nr:XRE family transcriptional regulator [Gammaproteobacteria bacterium]